MGSSGGPPLVLTYSGVKSDNDSNTTVYNETSLPYDLRFNDGHMLAIITYSILMVISAIGNITVLTIILKRKRKAGTRIHAMLMHLAIADLIVTFLMMPLEITWAWTVQWVFGDPMCRIMAFFRIFGLYLSSFILICISVDRYLAVLQPMRLYQMDSRGKLMIAIAWFASFVCSLPQSYIFHVERHPKFSYFVQCVTFNAYPSELHELAYLYFGMFMMYWLPLIVILFCYASIIIEIYRRSRESICGTENVRRLGFLGRAKSRTLKMTIIIVLAFVVCWTPYYIMAIWYWTDNISAQMVDQKVQHVLFMFACTNSCMNPIVYGAFNIRTRRTLVTQGTGESIASLRVITWHKLTVRSKNDRKSNVEDSTMIYTRCQNGNGSKVSTENVTNMTLLSDENESKDNHNSTVLYDIKDSQCFL
ncbi:adipokinetic hormone/corazonin-related peptide receptor variant I isoform X2 [Adelges cooleyi]|uniref:adipokinetic hormone/corazonin-related peptide receptor variant I isoform X2 n=1 Tax=Adelges cooleyi TaxID=133065 RepID=UPI0021809B65|nr:adipokinetic hormone/corazonin-related peptide receptor variant I isoform X2 [Adelges cooleyi]